MKTFKQDFLTTKEKMTPQEFNKNNNDDLEVGEETIYIYVYMEFYYIHINGEEKMGGEKSYGLTLGNEYIESDNLNELEIKLYNDWFIDNVMGKEEWLPYIGIHTNHTSGHYYIMFEDMGFDVEDISYGNDIVDCLRLSINNIELFDVLLPNSANDDSDREEFNEFFVHHLERSDGDANHYDRCEVYEKNQNYDNIESLQEAFEWRFHQLAKEYMARVLALNYSYPLLEDNVQSLDEFMNDKEVWEFFPKNKSLKPYLLKVKTFVLFKSIDSIIKEEGYAILGLFDEYVYLDEDMRFGCEPTNMFEDGRTKKDAKVQASFQKAKVLIEKHIANGYVPLDFKGKANLDFVELGEYFDNGCLISDLDGDVDSQSDLIDLIDDFLEFDCSISYSLGKWHKKCPNTPRIKYLISYLQNSDKIKSMWLDSEIRNIPNQPLDILEECYMELRDDEISVDDYNDMKKARDYYMRKSSELTKEIKKLNNLKIK